MLLDDLLEDIPVEYRERYEALYACAGRPMAELKADLHLYLTTIRDVASVAIGMDLALAERLANVLLKLVEAAGHDAERRSAVDAAVTYFVQEDEDEEITGVLGFDDDVQVINAVARALGRDDLVLPLLR